MAITTTPPLTPLERGYRLAAGQTATTSSVTSAVSWGAIAAGAAAAASLSLILLILGVGLGLSSVSPWAREGISAASFGVSTIVWLTLTQLLSSAMGGYLAGRLRTKWLDTHTDEVYFRDTAHGFLAWAVASLATAALLTSAIGSILSGGIQAGASVVGGVANTATVAAGGFAASGKMASEENGPMAYFVDSLFRRDGRAEAAPSTGAALPAEASERTMSKDAGEVSRIFANVSRSEPLPPEDIRYVGQLVAQRTGVSQQEAEKRVTDLYARAQAKLHKAEVATKDAADKARQASAYAALWIFVSLLIGAFVASLAATYGGRQRDA
ncbi:hypothetical protein ACLIKD_20715 [Azonexus sp. IMCC34842]|uniref:hypothetical protein n=1 Tax=Azonexus sp. IMCC34842 TaxID=3420950 RepID=UPI003D131392